MMEPMVYIILVNYNGYADTLECIKSIKAIDYSSYKIILIDNASKDAELIKKDKYINENAIVIFLKKNKGFSDGNNTGIKMAISDGADYVLLLNNDTVVDPYFLSYMIDIALGADDIGIVTGDIYHYVDKNSLWYSCGRYDRKTNITSMVCRTDQTCQEVNFACGCLALLSVDMVKKIGLLDDTFFLYSEDTDYSCRAVDRAWKIIWTSDAKIYHKVSASVEENSDVQSYYLIRNNLYMVKKYSPCPLRTYIIRFLLEIKGVIRKRNSMRSLCWAVDDFMHEVKGKSNRF